MSKPIVRKRIRQPQHVADQEEDDISPKRPCLAEIEEKEDEPQNPTFHVINPRFVIHLPLANDTLVPLDHYEIINIAIPEIRECFDNIQVCHPLVMRSTGVFGSFFSLVHQHSLPDGNKMDMIQKELAKDISPKYRKNLQKTERKVIDDTKLITQQTLPGGFENRYEMIIPRFGCDALAIEWNTYQHPFDFVLCNEDMPHVASNNMFSARPSGADGQKNAFPCHPMDIYVLKFKKGYGGVDHLHISLNISAIDRMIAAGVIAGLHDLPCADFMFQKLKRNIPASIDVVGNDDYKQQVRPRVHEDYTSIEFMSNLDKICQDRLNVILFPFQKDAIAWMMSVEDRKAPSISTHTIRCANDRLCYDVVADRLILDKKDCKEASMPYHGGILADEMGLGKTVQMMSLIAAHPMVDSPNIARSDEEEKNIKIISRATLVIAPNHLVIPVWKTIFLQTIKPGAKIVTITTKHDFDKLTVKQLMFADVVVVSAEFMVGVHHIHTVDARMDVDSRVTHRTKPYSDNIRSRLANLDNDTILGIVGLPLNIFHWHRLVIDEFHELLGNGALFPLIQLVDYSHVWCLSGTPFLSSGIVSRACDLLGIFDDLVANETPLLVSSRANAMPSTLMWRTMKERVKDQLVIPTMVEHVHVLDFTPTESMLYQQAAQNKSVEKMQELCCQVRLEGDLAGDDDVNGRGRTLDEIEDILIATRRKLLDETRVTLQNKQSKLERKQSKLDSHNGINPEDFEYKLAAVQDLENEVDGLHDQSITLERELTYFEAAVALRGAIQKDPATGRNALVGQACPVCMEDVIPDPALTSCGHLYCLECIKKCKDARGQRKCAVCRKQLDKNGDILSVAINEDNDQLLPSVRKYGTKMGTLLCHLREVWANSPDDRIIIFASKNQDLQRLSRILKEEHIAAAFCRGNVATRNKAFAQFNDIQSNVRIMMLSLEGCAAGSNLTIASEIVLLDSIWNANYAKQLASELQALNRAHRVGQTKQVRIVRFLIRDTMETERFHAQNPDFDPNVALTTRELSF